MSDPTPGPQVGSWLQGVESGSIPEASVPVESDTQETYTNLIGRDWGLRERGYKEMPLGYTRSIPDCYPKGVEMRDRLFFGNPSMVTICQNAWSDGLDGSPCRFDREKADGFRKKDLETKHKVGTSEHRGLAYCPLCAHTLEDIEKCPSLKVCVISELGAATCADGLSWYEEFNHDRWEGEHRFARSFTCDGENGIIQCKTKKFGAGLENGSENIPCPGYYGGSIVFGNNEEQADRSFKRVERTWQPGEVAPVPDVVPPSPPNPLTYQSSSDGIPSVSDHGQEQGAGSSSS